MPPIVSFQQSQPSMLTRKQLNRTLRTLSLDSDGGSQLLEIAPRVQVISGHCADKWPAEAGIMSASYTFCGSLEADAAVPRTGLFRTLDDWRSGKVLWALHPARNGHHTPRHRGRHRRCLRVNRLGSLSGDEVRDVRAEAFASMPLQLRRRRSAPPVLVLSMYKSRSGPDPRPRLRPHPRARVP